MTEKVMLINAIEKEVERSGVNFDAFPILDKFCYRFFHSFINYIFYFFM